MHLIVFGGSSVYFMFYYSLHNFNGTIKNENRPNLKRLFVRFFLSWGDGSTYTKGMYRICCVVVVFLLVAKMPSIFEVCYCIRTMDRIYMCIELYV